MISLIVLILSIRSVLTECPYGRFGDSCEYSCHCRTQPCNPDGSCSDGLCELGWFGLKCQYFDFLATGQFNQIPVRSLDWLSDGLIDTCDTNYSHIILDLDMKSVFTWLRIVAPDMSFLPKLNVSFSSSYNEERFTWTCDKRQLFLLDGNTVDVYCDIYGRIDQVIIEGLDTVCSLHISAGQNVALHQQVFFTSEPTTFVTDGNDSTCVYPKPLSLMTTWSISFDVNYTIVLAVAVVESFKNSYIWPIFFFADKMSLESSRIYLSDNATEITLPFVVKSPIYRIDLASSELNACEVYLFGECPAGKWGLSCKQTCDVNCPESCHMEDGKCREVCDGTILPPGCLNVCPTGTYGDNCQYSCHCKRKTCNPDGSCRNNKCEDGWFGLKCQYRDALQGGEINGILMKDFRLYLEQLQDCYINYKMKAITLTLNKTTTFTWLRIISLDTTSLYNLTVHFLVSKESSQLLQCNQRQMFIVDTKTVDIYCTVDEIIQVVKIIGLNSICSIHINGGQNIASCTQPTQCQLTNDNANWIMNLTNTFTLTYVEIFTECEGEFTSNGDPLYLNMLKNQIIPNKQVALNGTHFCQINAFGECLPGKCGVSCLQDCDSRCHDFCHIDDCICKLVCLGYSDPPRCTKECMQGTWGFNCNETCNSKCLKDCNRTTGLCDGGNRTTGLCDGGNRTTGLCDGGNRTTGLCDGGSTESSDPLKCVKSKGTTEYINGSSFGFGAGVSFFTTIVILVIIGVVMYRRFKDKNIGPTEETCSNYDNVEESNNYISPSSVSSYLVSSGAEIYYSLDSYDSTLALSDTIHSHGLVNTMSDETGHRNSSNVTPDSSNSNIANGTDDNGVFGRGEIDITGINNV